MSYTNAIKKALGKRRMAKILEVDTYGMLMVDIAMKEGWFYDGSSTCVFAEWAPDQGEETWQEFLKHLKNCVDEFEYRPELEEAYMTLPPTNYKKDDGFEEIILNFTQNPSEEIECDKPDCDYCKGEA